MAVVADSAQYSASISELAPRDHIGTALTVQTSLGFLLTLVSIRLIPALVTLVGWHWAFLPSFLSELIPMWDLVPTWTAAVWYVTSGALPGPGAPSARVEPPPPPPALKP